MRDQDGLAQRSNGQRRDVDDALVPGKQTRVLAGPRNAAAVPGKATQAGARDADASGAFESVLADGHRHREALAHALARGDQSSIKESAASLDTAIKLIKETMTAGGAEHAAPRMHAAIDLVSHAEPLLARSRGGSAKNATDIAAQGTRGAGHQLPHLDTIQKSFGKHDVGGVRAHVGGPAAAAAGELGATAYTHENAVGFSGAPSLHLAAHEAAHVVQQRGGVQFKGGVDGGAGDSNERHADAVADAVVSGKSAEKLLDASPGGGAAVQRFSGPDPGAAPAPAQTDDAKEPQDRGGRPAKGAGGAPKAVAANGGGAAGGGAVATGGGGGKSGGSSGGSASFQAGGDLKGDPLKAQLATFTQTVKADTASAVPPDGVHADPKKDSTEDHAKKVSQYRDGIDGIAGLIGDLDAFDALCNALGGVFGSGRDEGKQNDAIAQIRASKPFHQLSQMWQGALDGGQDSGVMQAAFEAEFESRGFFGSTQDAYRLVRNAAKAQAAEDAKAAAAKKKAQDAANKGQQAAKNGDAKDGKTTAGQPNAQSINVAGAGGVNAALLNASVEQQAAPIPALMKMKGVSDDEFKSVLTAADQHAGLAASVPMLGSSAPRTTQILGQLGRAGSSFEESFVDTVKWGAIAHFGDKLVGGGLEKLVGEKVPIVGPLIQLWFDKPWSGKYWSDTGKGFSEGWDSMKSAIDMSAFKSCHSFGDYVGVMFAKFADLFSMFYSWLNTIDKLVGTLSAVCLILGAVLIGVGIALCWLGIGEALMAAGGWLVEAGEVLGDIALSLMPICLGLSAMSLVCRTAASFLVPADVYAQQLAQEGNAADTFGKMAGQKVGLDTARTIEEATPAKGKPKAATPDATTENANAAGTQDAAQLGTQAEAGTQAMQGTVAKATAEHGATSKPEAAGTDAKPEPQAEAKDTHAGSPAAKETGTPEAGEPPAPKPEAATAEAKPETTAEDKPEGTDENKDDKTDDKDANKKSAGERLKAAAKELGRRLAQSANVTNNLGNNLRRLGGSLAELGELNPFSAKARAATANRGLAAHEEQIDSAAENAKQQLDDLGKAADGMQDQIDEMLDELTKNDGSLSAQEVAELNRALEDTVDSWGKAKTEAERVQTKVENLEKMLERARSGAEQHGQPEQKELEEGNMAEDEGASADSTLKARQKHEAAMRDAREKLGETKKKASGLEKDVEQSKQAVEAAKAQKAQADATAQAALDKLESNPANEEKVQAAEAVDAHEQALARAKELEQKAGKIRSAEQRRKAAEGVLKPAIGKSVEIEGAAHEIVGFAPEGVVVKPAGGGPERTVPAADLQGHLPDGFAEQVDKLATAKADVAKLTEGETGGNAGAIAHDLQQQAGEIKSRETRRRSPKKEAKWKHDKDLAAEWKNERSQIEEPQKAADSALDQAEHTLEKQETDLDEANEEKTELEDQVTEHKDEANKLRRVTTRHKRTEFALEHGTETAGDGVMKILAYLGVTSAVDHAWHAHVDGLVTKLEHAKAVVSSKLAQVTQPVTAPIANAAGALFTGGAADQREQLITAGQAKSDEAKATSAEGKPAEGASEGKPTEAAAAKPTEEKKSEKPEGGDEEQEKKELNDEALKIGGAQALYEALFRMAPPGDLASLGDHRQKAADAFVRYRDAHDRAYQAFVNEQAVGKLAQDSAKLAEQGKPLHTQAQQMSGPLDKSKSDEQKRQSTIAGAQPGDVKGADSRMGGLVMGLISKIGDNSDHLSQKPDAGGASGDQMASGQDKAKSEADGRTEQGKAHSQGQLQFLDQAQALRGKQEAALAGNVSALETKQKSELGSQSTIRERKAQALAEEAAAKAECESEANAFNQGYAKASAWAKLYEAKRMSLKSGEAEKKD